MQVSVTSPEPDVARVGGGGYLLAGGSGEDQQKGTGSAAQSVPITIRSIDPNVQHHQVYSIQPVQVQGSGQAQQIVTAACPKKSDMASPESQFTPKMKSKKGNKKNVWVPGKPLTPKAREMMESGKGSMNQDGRWTCVECNRSLSNEWTLEQHIQTVHGERIFNCKNCNKKFKRRDHLLNHIKTIHKGLKPCKKCNVVFINKEELRAHKMAVHLKLAPEDSAPPPLAKNTAQDVHQYLDEPSPPVTPVAGVQPVQVARSNNVVASYDNLVEGFTIPTGQHQVVVTINPQQVVGGAQNQTIAYQPQQISVVPVAVSHSAMSNAQPVYQVTPSGGLSTVATTAIQAAQPVAVAAGTAPEMTSSISASPVKPAITYSNNIGVPKLPTRPLPPTSPLLPKKIVIPDTLTCDVLGCEKSFKTADDYTAHRQLLHEEKRCSLCRQLCAGSRSLRAHSRSHEAGINYKCSQCPGTFKLQTTLQEHVDLFHTATTCLECGSCLFGSEQTNDHIADQHAPTRVLDQDDVQEGCNYQCSACFYAFVKRFEAERHFIEAHMTTDNEKVFHCCMYCKEVFLSFVRLDDHIQWEHGLEEIDENAVIDDAEEQVFFQCEICDHFFEEETMLQKHIKTVHTQSTRIPLQNKTNNDVRKRKSVELPETPKTSRFKCHYLHCKRSFDQKVDFDHHILNSHEKDTENVDHQKPVNGDEIAKAVESILGDDPSGTSGEIYMDDINKIAAQAVISPVIDDDKYEAMTVIEDSGIVEKYEETSAAVEAILSDDGGMDGLDDIPNGKVNGNHFEEDFGDEPKLHIDLPETKDMLVVEKGVNGPVNGEGIWN